MNEALRQELLSMQAEDQAIRTGSAEWDRDVDRRHTARLKEIVRAYGFPGKSTAGTDGSFAAWLLAQHADHDREFQREFLAAMSLAVGSGEADPRNYAYLTDRVRLGNSEPQVYGTQYRHEDEFLVLCPVQEQAALDERRRAIGLNRAAEYLVWALALEVVRRAFQIPNPIARCTENAPGQWAVLVGGSGKRVRLDIAWDDTRQGCRVVKGPELEP